jgi:hypothetical protein
VYGTVYTPPRVTAVPRAPPYHMHRRSRYPGQVEQFSLYPGTVPGTRYCAGTGVVYRLVCVCVCVCVCV